MKRRTPESGSPSPDGASNGDPTGVNSAQEITLNGLPFPLPGQIPGNGNGTGSMPLPGEYPPVDSSIQTKPPIGRQAAGKLKWEGIFGEEPEKVPVTGQRLPGALPRMPRRKTWAIAVGSVATATLAALTPAFLNSGSVNRAPASASSVPVIPPGDYSAYIPSAGEIDFPTEPPVSVTFSQGPSGTQVTAELSRQMLYLSPVSFQHGEARLPFGKGEICVFRFTPATKKKPAAASLRC